MEHLVSLESLATTTCSELVREYNQVSVQLVQSGSYYYHYLCDGQDDRGWGCGYRSLQSLCSWAAKMKEEKTQTVSEMISASKPSIPNIATMQSCLVDVGDKPKIFLGSKEWIGCYEACIILDHIYRVSSKIIHIPKGSDMSEQGQLLFQHFKEVGSPVMIGGDEDGASKTLIGIALIPDIIDVQFLIADPHYCGAENHKQIIDGGYIKWCSRDLFDPKSFYNMCLPQHFTKR